MRCPDCAHLNMPGVPRCEKCGATLSEEKPRPSPPSEPAPGIEAAGSGISLETRPEDPGLKARRRKEIVPFPEKSAAPTEPGRTAPACYAHPDRPTRDKCKACARPVCAMCMRRRHGDAFCADCFSKTSGAASGRVSGKFAGFSGALADKIGRASGRERV